MYKNGNGFIYAYTNAYMMSVIVFTVLTIGKNYIRIVKVF